MKRNTSNKDALLSIQGLSVSAITSSYDLPILQNVDLTVQKGEVLGVIGESGAGKSTIGLAALGIVRAGCHVTSGQVTFNGQTILTAKSRDSNSVRGTRIAYVSQSAIASLNPGHRLLQQTVEGCVTHGLLPRGKSVEKAKSLYAQLQLPDPETFGQRFPHQVSGGQLQRAMIAMALMTDPELVIFDEPTTALDVTTQLEVIRSIKSLVEARQMSAMYVSHDLPLVAQVAQRIVVLRYGQVIETSEVRKMLSAPKHEYTRSLWAVRELMKPEAEETAPIIEMKNVCASYGTAKVLNNINISVSQKHTLALVGESGSGKSTIAKVITGILNPDSGQISFGRSLLKPGLAGRSLDEARRIQLIHQNPDSALNPRNTVRKILTRPVSIFDVGSSRSTTERLETLLDMVKLPRTFLSRFPSELSGGEKQRVAIARALAAKPDVIVCDEITSALDQLIQRDIIDLLIELQRSLGVTYIFITHDLATVRAIADEVVVLRNGEIIAQGPKNTVLSPPFDPYTERLISSVPELDPDWLDQRLSNDNRKVTVSQ